MIRPLASALRAGSRQKAHLVPRVPQRSIVVLRNGNKFARGLKKEESEYMTSTTGITYPGDQTTLKPAREFLGEKYTLPDEVILQTLTHKSFAHGKKPFNERLANLGRIFLRMHAFIYASSQGGPVGQGYNFDIDNKMVDLLSSNPVLAQVCRQARIDQSIFWKRAYQQSGAMSGADTVAAKTIDALVGAVYVEYGEKKAAEFVKERLLQGPYNVVPLSAPVYKSRQEQSQKSGERD